MLHCRQLRCERITVHKNLFVSYVLTGIVWILYYILVTLNGDILLANPVSTTTLEHHVTLRSVVTSPWPTRYVPPMHEHLITLRSVVTSPWPIRYVSSCGKIMSLYAQW